MPNRVDGDSLRSVCSAIAATDFDPFNRIKAIVQVAHEYLGTSSVTAYAFNRITGDLDIVAMPGVTNREVMRGPTDRVLFAWEEATTDAGLNGVWMETQEQFDDYKRRLERSSNWPSPEAPRTDFRQREGAPHATAKIYLWKGIGQTWDKVGQMFFNFRACEGDTVFTPEIKDLVIFVSKLVREILIDSLYHANLPTVHWSPERLLRELNVAFDSRSWREAQSFGRIESKIANIILDAAMSVTENFGGHADFILLIGERLGCVFDQQSEHKPVRTILIAPDSITGSCIRDKKYFIGSKVAETRWYPHEFDKATCCSLMIVPILHDGEVRGVLRLTSPRPGCFLDAQARAMQSLEHFARYGILRLVECRQRTQMGAALDFYTSGLRQPHAEDASGLMKGVLRALGAAVETYWPIERIKDDGTGVITGGIQFNAGGKKAGTKPREIPPEDRNYGVRSEAGFTQALLRFNWARGDCTNTFFALHVLPQQQRSPGGEDSTYLLEVFSRQKPADGIPHSNLEGRYFRCAFKEGDSISLPSGQALGPIKLNRNTSQRLHTRMAFVVCENQNPRAVVWLVFPNLHDVALWEIRYIEGLSNSLGKLMQVHDLDLAIRSFRHRIPELSDPAADKITSLRERAPTEFRQELYDLETYMLAMLWKIGEVKTLEASEHMRSFLGRRSISEYVERAIAMAAKFDVDRSAWKAIFQGVNPEKEEVSGVFFCALLNLLDNVNRHARWVAEGNNQVLIWVRKLDGFYSTCVANTGQPLNKDPIRHISSFVDGNHGSGLRIVKALLERHRGEIRFLSRKTAMEMLNPPESWDECKTFFEFRIPLIEQQSTP